MSCAPGEPCEEGVKRRRALLVLGLMGVIFIALSAASFLKSRGQAVPATVSYAGADAVAGKRVFQAYNCMGCHTIVGNGAYFGPDLTKVYDEVGPAWLEAFLPSAGSWPTKGAVALQLRNQPVAEEAGVDSIEAYLDKYSKAAERISRRGGHASLMPNLPLSRTEISQVIAFLKYTSAMNTEGWPPKPRVDGLGFPQAAQARSAVASPVTAARAAVSAAPVSAVEAAEAAPEPAPVSEAARGEALALDTGCTACHARDSTRLVGPGWGGLYGHEVTFTDGTKAMADDAYLTESIVNPDAKVVAGYAPHMMPAYSSLLDESQIAAIVAYIRSLGGEHP